MANVEGTVAPGFEPVREAFARNFADHDDIGAAVCIHHRGQVVVDLWGGIADPATGRPWSEDTLQLVFSTTKGIVAIAAHQLAERGLLDLDAPVAGYWPEFASAGKHGITVRQLLNHTAGLAGVDREMTYEEFLRWDPVVERLAEQPPNWEPGTAHGYHAITYGFLVGEVIRRITGGRVGEYVAREIAKPVGAEFYVGLPEAVRDRVATLVDFPPSEPDEFFKALLTPGTMTYRAFMNPPVMITTYNDPALQAAEIPAANGITNARSLSRIYAATIGEVDGVRLLRPETLDDAVAVQAEGPDLVLIPDDTRIATGFMLPTEFLPMSGPECFGHPGMGGSIGFADRRRDLAFGYVMNQALTFTRQVDPRSGGLIAATLECIG
jgi:CubicO group peptidase (beta-lactamase class C family)